MVTKIAFLAPEFYNAWGGVGIYSVGLLRELQKDKDLDVHILTPDIVDSAAKSKINEDFNNCTIHALSTAKDTFVYNLKFQLALLREFPKLHNKYGFDILHSANLVHMPDIFLKFKDLGIPSVVTAHTTIKGQVAGFLESNKNPLKMAASEKWCIATYPIISCLEKIYLLRTHNYITVSERFKRRFQTDYKIKDEIEVIYNSIDTKNYDYSRISTDECEEQFPFLKNINKPVIFFAGRLITQKGIDVFIEALSNLKKQGVEYKAIVAGKGDDERLLSLVKEHDLTDDVMFIGYVNNKDLCYLYRFADVFALPSYYENFPISLLESMSMRCVPVATDVGAVDEIIDDGKNGFIIKAGDAGALTEQLKILLENSELRHQFAMNGQKKIIENHSSITMAEKTKSYYKRILK